jgi:dTDP-4-amino-4,6-dideoxygalactose transaminase
MIPIAKPIITQENIENVKKILKSGFLTSGPSVKKFEEEFAKYCGVNHGIATSNGTTALQTALIALGIKKGDEIITTPFSFIASANCVLFQGGIPVFADINPKTFNIDPEKIEEKITKKTKAIIVVHLYGQPCQMDKISQIAENYNLKIIEDACQAHGAEFKGKKTGSLGDVGCFSFYGTKNMTTGEGGMLVTNSESISKKCKLIINHGQINRYYHDILGFNFRMTEFQGVIGLGQLKNLDNWNNTRRENAKKLSQRLRNLKSIITPYVSSDVKHVFHQYTIRTKDISNIKLSAKLTEKGIGNKIYYPVPIHKQKLYRDLGYRIKLPNSEKASEEVLSIPVHPSLTNEDLKAITDGINNLLS